MNDFSNEWRNFQRALNMHMHMEDNGFFQLLDSLDNSAVSEAGLGNEHVQDLELRANIDKAIAEGNKSSLKQAFDAWRDYHLEHLTHEEEVMMPIVPKAGNNCVEHGQRVHDHLLSAIDSMDEFDWTLGWILQKLNSAKDSSPPADVMVRVFVWGLHYSADDSQWQRWLPIIKDNVSPELYQTMVDKFHIDRSGRVGVVTDLKEEFSFLSEDDLRPVPFAVMRNTHEAIRLSINEMNNLLNDLLKAA